MKINHDDYKILQIYQFSGIKPRVHTAPQQQNE